MFGCRSPSRRSARWTTSLQPWILHLFSPTSVTSDSWCNKLCTDAKQPAHAHLRIALALHFPSFLFSVFMGLQIIQPVLVLSPTLFSFRGAWSTVGSHTAPPCRQILFSTLLLPPELLDCPAFIQSPMWSSLSGDATSTLCLSLVK